MKTFEKRPMLMVLGQLLENPNWTSRSWVDATMQAMDEAVREAHALDGRRAVEATEPGRSEDEREQSLFASLASCPPDDELRTLGMQFLKLREQYRPTWSADDSGPRVHFGGAGKLKAVHRR